MRLVPVLPFSMGLGPLLRWGRRVLGIAHVFLALGVRLVLVVILPIPHRSILPVSLPRAFPAARRLASGQWPCRARQAAPGAIPFEAASDVRSRRQLFGGREETAAIPENHCCR